AGARGARHPAGRDRGRLELARRDDGTETFALRRVGADRGATARGLDRRLVRALADLLGARALRAKPADRARGHGHLFALPRARGLRGLRLLVARLRLIPIHRRLVAPGRGLLPAPARGLARTGAAQGGARRDAARDGDRRAAPQSVGAAHRRGPASLYRAPAA